MNKLTMTARQQGKSEMFRQRYGGMLKENLVQTQAQNVRRVLTADFETMEARVHAMMGPLPHTIGCPFVGYHFGIPVYKGRTKQTSEIVQKGQRVPHVDVWYLMLSEFIGLNLIEKDVPILAYFRKHNVDTLTTAIATLNMMGYDLVIAVKAFET